MKKLLFLLTFLSLLLPSSSFSGEAFNPFTSQVDLCSTVQEEDGSPSAAGCQTVKVSNASLTDNGDGTFSLTTGGGTSGWTDDGTEVRLDTSTDDVEIGSAAGLSSKLGINGDSDEIQFILQGNATQTSNLFVFEQSDGTDVMTGSNATIQITNPISPFVVTGAIRVQGLNCSANTNGGALTADPAGNIKCSNDDTSAGGGAPDDADYLVGTSNASLSAEIIVGTTPGGELGNTWASPTIDDSITVASWTLTSMTGSVADDVNFTLGTNDDWTLNYDESVDNQLLVSTVNTSAIATTDPMFEILSDFGTANGTGMTANQEIFGVAKGTQTSNVSLFTVDEDGDGLLAGTLGVTGGLTLDANTEANIEAGVDLAGEVTATDLDTTVITDNVTVTGWVMGDSTATTPAADDNDTSLATTAYVQGELDGYLMAGTDANTRTATFWTENSGTGTTTETTSDEGFSPENCTASRMYVGLQNAPGAGTSWTVCANVNGTVLSEPCCTISNTETECNETASTGAIVGAQTFNWEFAATGAVAGTGSSNVEMLCDP